MYPCCRRAVCYWERRTACAKCTSDGRRNVHLSCEVFETFISHLLYTCRARFLEHLSFTFILHLSCKGPTDWGAGGEGHQAGCAGHHHGCHCQDDHDCHGIVRMIIRGSKASNQLKICPNVTLISHLLVQGQAHLIRASLSPLTFGDQEGYCLFLIKSTYGVFCVNLSRASALLMF